MTLQKTNKTILTVEDILKYISDYEIKVIPYLNKLLEYYKGKNVAIIQRKNPNPNNPDNKIAVSYGRKIVNTYTGYGYRPKYITYKPNIKKTEEQIENGELNNPDYIEPNPIEKIYTNEMQIIYNSNNEHIKTNQAGKNIAIFGLSYELLYIDSEYDVEKASNNPVIKFVSIDPMEMIVLYNYDPEPKIIIAIRFFKMENDDEYKVEVYYKDKMIPYIRYRSEMNKTAWLLKQDGEEKINNFNDIPIIAFYRDEMQSVIECVINLIDAYDVLMSDSMNEFDRFAFAYLIMKKFGLSNPIDKKNPAKINNPVKNIKQSRIFENLASDADIKFLTKDIPTLFIQWMSEKLKMEIHLQSHIPDFTILTGALSGAAIDRLLFDFENLVSNDEAYFDMALIRRGELITDLLIKLKKLSKECDFATMININHKRNLPLDRNSFAQMAVTLSNAGFSRRMIVSQMPENMVPDVEAELEEEKEEQEAFMGANSFDNAISTEEPIPNEEIVSIDELNGAQIDSITRIAQNVAKGELTQAAAISLLQLTFPSFDKDRIKELISNIVNKL